MSPLCGAHAFLFDTTKPVWRIKLRGDAGLKKTEEFVISLSTPEKIFPNGKIRLQCQKIQTNAESSPQTEYRARHSLMRSEKLTLLMCSVTCGLIQPEMNKEASSISRLADFSITLSHLAHLQPVCESERLVQSFSTQ